MCLLLTRSRLARVLVISWLHSIVHCTFILSTVCTFSRGDGSSKRPYTQFTLTLFIRHFLLTQKQSWLSYGRHRAGCLYYDIRSFEYVLVIGHVQISKSVRHSRLVTSIHVSDKDKINLVNLKESIMKWELTVLLEVNCSHCILCNFN